jgi:hypothetical protein
MHDVHQHHIKAHPMSLKATTPRNIALTSTCPAAVNKQQSFWRRVHARSILLRLMTHRQAQPMLLR